MMSNQNVVNVFGTYRYPNSGAIVSDQEGNWTNVFSFSSVVEGTAINGAANANRWSYDFPFGTEAGTTWTPSAFSVQVMNGNALQTTTGIIAAGVLKTQLKIAGSTETWTSLADSFIAYQQPRLLSAGKLALRGVQMNSYPLNMSNVSEFTDSANTGSSVGLAYGATQPTTDGWAPIMVVNQDNVALTYLVTTEWRVRFNPFSPAASAHRHHPVASDSLWNTLMKRATALGNGVLEISDVVANVGQAVGRLRGAAPMPALMVD